MTKDKLNLLTKLSALIETEKLIIECEQLILNDNAGVGLDYLTLEHFDEWVAESINSIEESLLKLEVNDGVS